MRKWMAFIAVFLLSATSSLCGNHYISRGYTSEEGLPNNSVSSCCFDVFGRLWIGTKDGVCFYDGVRFIPFSNDAYRQYFSGVTLALCEDKDSNIWISSNKGVGFYNPQTDVLTLIPELTDASIRDIKMDSEGNIWLVSSTLISKFDRGQKKITKLIPSEIVQSESACSGKNGQMLFASREGDILVYDVLQDSYNSVPVLTKADIASGRYLEYIAYAGNDIALVSTSCRELIRVNLADGSASIIYVAESRNDAANIYCLTIIGNEYWIGTTLGVFIFDSTTGQVDHLISDPLNTNSLAGNKIRCIESDGSGDIWIGSFPGGLNLCRNRDNYLHRYYVGQSDASLTGHSVRAFCPDNTGKIWIGTETGEINLFDAEAECFEDFSHQVGIPNGTIVTDILCLGDRLLFATYGGGIFEYDIPSGIVTNIHHPPCEYCLRLMQSRDGELYVGTAKGGYLMKSDGSGFEILEPLDGLFVHDIFEDSEGLLWVGTYGQGIRLIDRENKTCTPIIKDRGLQSRYVTSFYEDSRHCIWITTDGYGVGYIGRTEQGDLDFPIRHITRQDGLTSNNICSIVESVDGVLWLSSSNGIIELDPTSKIVRKSYMQSDQLVGGNFNSRASYYAPSDMLYLGTSRGMVAFRPGLISEMVTEYRLNITDVLVGNQRKRMPLASNSASGETGIRLKPQDAAFFSVSFFTRQWDESNVLQYEYSLKGRSANSKVRTTDNYATYTDLRPGKYQFSVSIVGSSSPEATQSLSITVVPPWYRSSLAVLCYSLLVATGILLLLRLAERKREEEQIRRVDLLEQKKQKELYDAKLAFFTNVTHEIRTPLTLITVPLEKIMAEDNLPERTRQNLSMIKSNTERLLKLSNQILDLRKLETTQAKIVFAEEDVRLLLIRSCDYFRQSASQNGINLEIHVPENGPVLAICNGEFIESIFCNLLSNGIKYGRSRIVITLEESPDDNKVLVRVNSDGDRIPEESRESIFNAFYQLSDRNASKPAMGTGLGLTYSRTLARLHNGTLYLDADVPDMNSFVLQIPKYHSEQGAPLAPQLEEKPMEVFDDFNPERHTILVAEDDPEMRQLLFKDLSEEYNVITAPNGKEALVIIETYKIDLVVSDIIMPVMDGCQLCNELKGNLEYSHIPIILLTAAVGVETHIMSLKAGADSYMEKPFSTELLHTTIANLFRNREIANKQFINAPLSHFNGMTLSKIDQDFIQQLHTVVMERISDQDLTLETLADLMLTSKSTLNRKVKADTGLTVNEYVRICRMKKAAELLASGKYRINEVAYLVGFTSPSYFSANFQKQFGILPSEFIKDCQSQPITEV